MTMTEAKAVLAMKPEDLLNMALVNAHIHENTTVARDDALARIERHEDEKARLISDHGASLSALQETMRAEKEQMVAFHADTIAGHELTRAELLAENARLRDQLAALHSIMDLTDGGKELLRQKQIAELHAARETKAREYADLEAQLAELLSAATDTGG